jgi:hypothetical protein
MHVFTYDAAADPFARKKSLKIILNTSLVIYCIALVLSCISLYFTNIFLSVPPDMQKFKKSAQTMPNLLADHFSI